MQTGSMVRPDDLAEYRRFVQHHLSGLNQRPPSEIWHYTNSEGLIGILKSGSIYATQVSCLNDNLEQRFFGDLILKRIISTQNQVVDENLSILRNLAIEALSNRDFSSASHFVACFSEVEDDLNQWRGYGGGECGYAIGFKVDGILKALQYRNNSILLPLVYDETKHLLLANDVVMWAEKYYLQGINRGGIDKNRWAREFFTAFALELDIFASMFKHPKFFREEEHRIATLLGDLERGSLIFQQKRTLLARHLPLDLKVGSPALLPLSRIFVGPGPAQRVSKVSVGDLLLQCGYADIPVELSTVPYRVP